MELNNLQPFSRLGRNVWLWAGNHVGHHSVIEDNCFIASHAVVSGAVTVGESSFIGVNATIRDNVKIGKRNVIGAGVVILADTSDAQVFIGQKTEASRVPSHRLRGI
jgi:UDP-3-O-[3-hydroxymyristoyl] glucosamine N-acyltransferase